MHRNLKFLHMTIFFSTDILVGLVTNMRYAVAFIRLASSYLFVCTKISDELGVKIELGRHSQTNTESDFKRKLYIGALE